MGPTDRRQQSLLHSSTWATDRSLIVPQHFLTSEEFLLQEVWFTREGTKPSLSKPSPPSTPPTPSTSWQYLLHDPFYPFPFHPSSNIPPCASPCCFSESPGLSHQGVSQREGGMSSVLTSRQTENSCGSRGSRRGGECVFVCDQMKVYNMTVLHSRAAFDHP